MKSALEEICKTFHVNEVESIEPFGRGHIHATYKVIDSSRPYLLQKINDQVFPDVPLLMNNIHLVTTHIKSQLTDSERSAGFDTLTPLPSAGDQLFIKDELGGYWRMYRFLDGLRSFEVAPSSEYVYEAARSFAKFLDQLAGLDPHKLGVVIKGFHNLPFRLGNLDHALSGGLDERKRIAKEELYYVQQVAEELSVIQRLGDKAKIPLRITHNDTKLNNVLFSDDGIGKCVVDLDTVMPGFVHYDFGDGVRSTVTDSKEDERDLDTIEVNMERFAAFTEGFLSATRALLTSVEMEHLAISAPLFSFIMGVRFLTDYLSGDTYYKTAYEDHNLVRTRVQFELTKKLLLRLADMQSIVRKCSGL